MDVKTIGVLGAGQMGSGIAQIAASHGYKVLLRDINREFCDAAMAKMKDGLDKRVAKGKITAEDAESALRNITICENAADLKDCDMIICESLRDLPVTDWSTPKSIEKLIEEGHYGRKSGSGWHDYRAPGYSGNGG